MYLLNDSNKIKIFLILYISLLLGFYFGENSSGGAYPDFLMRMGLIESFKNNFKETFFNYHNFNDRHSPLLIIIISFLNKLGVDLNLIRFIHLNFIPLIIFISYKCLILYFPNKNRNLLFLICCVFFLSASLRSIAIWPDSRLIGLFLFICSLYFFLNFKKTHNYKDCIYNNILLILCAYFSPNFSIFFLYFFFDYLKYYKITSKIIFLILINSFLALPMFVYLFIFKVNFFAIKAVNNVSVLESLNFSNKIFIISTIIFFYAIPLVWNRFSLKLLIEKFKIIYFYIAFVVFFLLFDFFTYSNEYTGGGIFFKFSYLVFGNVYFFFLVVFLSFIFLMSVFKKNFNNYFLFTILIVSNPQLTIYHKYYDPLLILFFLLLFDFKFIKNKIINFNFLINIYVFYSVLFIVNLGRYFI